MLTQIILLGFTVIYGCQIFYFYRGIKKIKKGNNSAFHSIAVLIPARNEEENIAHCITALLNQDYDFSHYSIHIINDHSTDKTVAIVEELIQKNPERIFLHHAPERIQQISPKINAFRTALSETKNEIILTTDADCVPEKNWISTMNSYFEDNVGAVAGFTHFQKNNTVSPILYGVQFLEFISFTSCGAGASGNGQTIISNGSNMGFQRKAFDEAGGYDSFAHHSNGDDSLLVQRIEETKNWMVKFVVENTGFVTTTPVNRWKDFFNQRLRWGSQARNYNFSRLLFMGSIFLYYMLLVLSLPVLLIAGSFSWLIFFTVKMFFDFSFLFFVLRKLRLRNLLQYFFPAALIHIPSVLYGVLGSLFFNYTWKERVLRPVNTQSAQG
ncbi:MAG: glycosyltransferase [Bacteroidetes bacterium]|nr:glycosyltransferase [Bacteroidota bacterium]